MAADPAPDPRAPWEPPDLAPLQVGDRVTVRISGECDHETKFDGLHSHVHVEFDGIAGIVSDMFPGHHRYLVLFDAPISCPTRDMSHHQRRFARAELWRRPDVP